MESQSAISSVLERLFFSRNTARPFFIITEHCLQVLFYLFVVSAHQWVCKWAQFDVNFGLAVTLFFLVLLAVRYLFGLSIIKIFYPPILCVLIYEVRGNTAWIAVIIGLLMLVLLVIDILSNIRMDFTLASITGETLNITKFMHTGLFAFGMIQNKIWPSHYAYLILFIGFAGLAFVKNKSLMQNDNFKELLIRIYLLLSVESMVIFIQHYVVFPTVAKYLTALILSQFILQVYYLVKKEANIQELYSQEKYFLLSFKIFQYKTGKTFSRKMETAIQNFVGSQLSSCLVRTKRRKIVFHRLAELLSRSKQFQNQILKTNIYIISNSQFLKARLIIQKLKNKTGYNFIKKLLVYRMDELLQETWKNTDRMVKFQHYQTYHKCEKFRNLLLKSATHHIQFWESSRKKDIQPEKMRHLGNVMLDYEDKIMKYYPELEPKCTTITLMLSSYLYQVERRQRCAKKLLKNITFNQDFEVNLKIHEKVFIRLELEEQPLRILKVGHNVSMLLGYERNQLQGQKHELFLPQFYCKTHRELVEKQFFQEMPSLHLYKKTTIIKNKHNYYQECGIVLKLHYQLGSTLRLQGFIHVRNVDRYDWKDFFFVNDRQEIMECGERLDEFAPHQSIVHFLKEAFGEKREVKMSSYAIKEDYFPLETFKREEGDVTYYVKKKEDPKVDTQSLTIESMSGFLGALSREKDQSAQTQPYTQVMRQVQSSIKSNQYFLLLGVGCLLMLGVISAAWQAHYVVDNKTIIQDNVLNTTSDILFFQTNATNLMLDVNYYDLKTQTGYANNFTKIDLIGNSLELHVLNERLRGIGVNSFVVPSNVPGITLTETSFQVVMEFLANAYILKKFQTDPFLSALTFQRERNIFYITNNQATGEYEDVHMNQLKKTRQDPQKWNFLILIGLILALIVLYLIVLRCEYKTRVNEQEALTLICKASLQEEMIQRCRAFIANITKEDLSIKKYQPMMEKSKLRKDEISFAPDMTATVTERQNTRSQISMRQLSGRNLMEDSLNNKSSFFPSKLKKNQNQMPKGSPSLKLSRRRKKWFIIPLVLIVLIIGFFTGNFIIIISRGIDEGQSATNLVNLSQQSHKFSRSVNNFFNYINLRVSGSAINSSTFISQPSVLLDLQRDIPFKEVSISQFYQFEKHLVSLQYGYLCTYFPCDPRFSNEINIVYTASIQKILKLMNVMLASFDLMNTTQLTTELSSAPTIFSLDLILYTQWVIRVCLTAILTDYSLGYISYALNYWWAKKIMIGLANLVIWTALGLLVFLVVRIYRNQRQLYRLVDIYRIDGGNCCQDVRKELEAIALQKKKKQSLLEATVVMVNASSS